MQEDIYYWLTDFLQEKNLVITLKADDLLGELSIALAEANGGAS